MKYKFLAFLSLFASCTSYSQNSSETLIYNDYFNFASNSMLNSVLTSMDLETKEQSSKEVYLKSDLPYEVETNKFNLVPVNNYQDFTNLTQFEGIDLRFNNYEEIDQIFQHLAKNNKTKSLRLNIHKLDSLPPSLYQITSLENLEYWTSNLKTIDESLENLINLERLKIHEAQNLIDLPKSIGKLKKLKILEINEGNYYGSVNRNLEPITELESLEYLRLRNFPIHIPSDFSHLKQLKLVEVYNHFQWYKIDLTNLYSNTAIKSLMLTGVSEEHLSGIKKLTQLEELYIGRRTSLEIFDNLKTLPKLTRLNIHTDYPSIPSAIQNCQHVNLLILRNCEHITEIPKELNHLSNLEILVLRNNFELVESNLDFNSLHNLFRVFLKNNKVLNDIPNCGSKCITSW